MEGPLGTIGVVAGALDRQFRRTAGAVAAPGEFVGGGEGQDELFGFSAASSRCVTASSTVCALIERQVDVACWSLRE